MEIIIIIKIIIINNNYENVSPYPSQLFHSKHNFIHLVYCTISTTDIMHVTPGEGGGVLPYDGV